MKIFLFCLTLGAAILIWPLQRAVADEAMTPGQNASSSGSTNSAASASSGATQGQHAARYQQMLAGLNLTYAQKDQIRQIRANVSDIHARREQILGVLTPDQKARLRALRQARQGAASAGGDTPGEN